MKRLGLGLAATVTGLVAFVVWPWEIAPARGFELVAHRGVHQTFPLDDLTNDTCTAAIVHPPTHGFLENTVPSMRAAFAAGATMVELDVHRTTDGELVVFHDWTLDCRTDGTGVTNQQAMTELRGLDLGHGYTADGGRTFPLRGTGRGLIRTLPEVLAEVPEGRFAIDDKDGHPETLALLRELLSTLPPEDHARLWYDGTNEAYGELRDVAPGLAKSIWQRPDVKRCLGAYLAMLATGSLPLRCRDSVIALPMSATRWLPGWPDLVLSAAHEAGVPVWVADVDTFEDWEELRELPLDGVITNRIEVLGPRIRTDLEVAR